ncbi:MAG: hypothetical protein HQL21_04785 [Candidatus Omnitrophica bacterium]|nr:hypothetical protein [Candidatus Omnitrophota bacterium]
MSREKNSFLTTNRIGFISLLCWGLSLSICSFGMSHAEMIDVSTEDMELIAERVFRNECHTGKDCLIEWNAGEEFLSLGLGHFIWYPQNALGIFEESFMAYLQYARDAGEVFPDWLNKNPLPPCPWSSREQMLSSKEGALYQDLLSFIRKTKQRQADFLVGRTKKVLPKVIEAAPLDQRTRIHWDLFWLTNDAQGLYAVVDYVNFKGAGIKNSENYKGQGWGLLQVLQNMRDTQGAQETLEEFARSAKEVLTRRVANAPVERHEEKWLRGWLHRIDSYLVR